ncbi:MAG: hypothetical protein MK052_00625 [Alphaproteobacteria bacterium]|nr:hypothetical protein [Alphaproteobacteria bacterium]
MAKHPRIPEPNALNLSSEAVAGGGAAAIASKITWPIQDAMHLLHSTEAVRTGAAAHSAMANISHLGSTIAANVGGVVGIAAGTGVSAYLNHMVQSHHEKTMTERYRPELASILGKDEEEIKVPDLYKVASANPGLDQELDRNRGMRNIRTASTLLATTAAFVAVFAAVSLVPPLGALGASAVAGGIMSVAGAKFIGASMAISLATLHTTGKGLNKLSKKMFGYNEPNVEDHVNGLDNLVKKGKELSSEKVMGVYVAASPALQEQVRDSFGKSYDKLSTPQQVKAEKMFGSHLPLEQAAEAINSGDMRARELIFTVHGQSSGLSPSLDAPRRFNPKVPDREYVQEIERPVEYQAGKLKTLDKDSDAKAVQSDEPINIEKAVTPEARPKKQPISADQWQEMVESRRAETASLPEQAR